MADDDGYIKLDVETVENLRDEIARLRKENRQLKDHPLTKEQRRLLARVDEAWRGFWTRGGANPHIARDRGEGSLAWLQETLELAFRDFSKSEEAPVLTEAEKAELGDIFGAYNEVARLRQEIERLKHEPGCILSGPGRGDCEHFVGLPGVSIPGQHDGQDDTVDHYGKPNGWCWPCWVSHQRSQLSEQLREADEQIAQLQVQIAGCLTAADGATGLGQIALPDDYGWSPAYDRVLQLRIDYDEARGKLKAYEGQPEPEDEEPVERPSRWDKLRGV